MKYKIAWLENKADDWKVVSLESGEKDVSINRKSKKGELFPEFDNLKAGMEIEGELWQSPAGKWYLFPPKASKSPSNGGYKQKLIEDAQNTKRTDISQAQEVKNDHIRQAAAQRDAVLIVVNLYRERYANDPILSETELDTIIKKKIIQIRDWFLSTDFTNITPF